MIAYIHGKIINVNIVNGFLIVNNNNIGYKVYTSLNILSECSINNDISLYIHTYVSQDDIKLFGFANIEHLYFFEKLISISGVGPKTALNFFNYDVDKIQLYINVGDIEKIPKISGIGHKTMQKIVLELSGKMNINQNNQDNKKINEVKNALLNLGFTQKDIDSKLKDAPTDLDTENLIRWFLKNIN